MLKQTAIEMLGGTPSALARAVGVSLQAVQQWPPDLPPRLSDRVLAALYRRDHPELAQPDASTQANQSAA